MIGTMELLTPSSRQDPHMNLTAVLKEIDAWPVDEQVELLEKVWDKLAESGWQPAVLDDLKAELDRRLDALDANPDDVLSWDQVVDFIRRPQ